MPHKNPTLILVLSIFIELGVKRNLIAAKFILSDKATIFGLETLSHYCDSYRQCPALIFSPLQIYAGISYKIIVQCLNPFFRFV